MASSSRSEKGTGEQRIALLFFYILLGILMAPSNRSTVPFNIEFSMLCLTNAANSSGFPARTGNSITLSKLFRAFSLSFAVIALSNRLGAIVTALIPYLARSRDKGSVRDAMAPLDAEYATWPGWPSNAAEDATRIRTPRSPSGGRGLTLIMCGRHWRMRSRVPRRLMFRTKSICSMGTGVPVRPSIIYIALPLASRRVRRLILQLPLQANQLPLQLQRLQSLSLFA